MEQIVLKVMEDDLIAEIRELAELDGISENDAAIKLLRNGVNLDISAKDKGKIGNSLDHFMGKWSDEEAAEFDAYIAGTRVVD